MLKRPETGFDTEAYIAGRWGAGLPMVFDLGCGAKKVPGALGVDIVALPGVNLVHDLESTPYPRPENCADEIHLNHVLEHFENPLPILEEIWRIARPGVRVFRGEELWPWPTAHGAVRCNGSSVGTKPLASASYVISLAASMSYTLPSPL